jgi:transcription elongation factor GreA
MPLVPRPACAGIAAQLRAAGAGAELAEGEREILARPDAHSGALAWLWRQCASATDEGEADVDPAAVALKGLSSLAGLVRAADLDEGERRERIAELRTALFVRDGRPLREVLEGARPEQVAAAKSLGERNPGLTPAMQESLAWMLRAIQPALYEKDVPPWEQEVVYATPAGVERRKAELEQIVHERLPRVMREIGQAANFGDVSDNAEYQSAVQERARLADRAARIQEEIDEARLITPEMAQAEHVTIGSRVVARNLATGEREEFTFLGPWDASAAARVYAYNAPLGREFMGKPVGETVTFRMGPEERSWEIIAIGPAL